MITANKDTPLGYVCQVVDDLRPNQSITVACDLMKQIAGFNHNGARFSPADRVCENIVGSARTVSYRVDMETGDVTFLKHEDGGVRRYTSPDRRKHPA